jgi:hypothetical protein
MSCPACGGRTVSFSVPPVLHEHAPESSAHATLCSTCLRVHPTDERAVDSDVGAVHPSFPSGESGAALALALGLLDSLAVRRAAIEDCCRFAEEAGADVLLTLDRLAAAEGVDPHFDLDRRRLQLADLLS